LSDRTDGGRKEIGDMGRRWFARSGRSSWHLRTYFALLLALFALVAVAAFVYVVKQTNQDARRSAEHDARSAADTSAQQLGDGLALLNSAVVSLTGNPQIPQVMANPGACTLTFSWLTPGHLDLIRTDGTVVCSSRAAKGHSGLYAGQSWLSRALAGPVLIGPLRFREVVELLPPSASCARSAPSSPCSTAAASHSS
jgi:type II secretory pathway pseudopilin PulG